MKTSLPRYLLITVGLTFGGLVASAAEAPNMATVLQITGSATALMPGSTTPQPIQQGDKLPQGASITTGPGSTVNIQPFSGAVSTINSNSTVSLDKLSVTTNGSGTVTKQTALIKLKTGNVVSMLDPGNKSINDYGVSTAKGVAAARGTSFTSDVDGTGSVTVSANADSVVFTTAEGTFTIVQGNVTIAPAGGGAATTVSLASLAGLTTPAALAAQRAVQAGVTALVNVMNSPNAGGLGAAASAQLATAVVAVSNVAAPASASTNTAALVAGVATAVANSPAVAGVNATTAAQTVMLAAVEAAPTQAANITSSVATSLNASNSGANATTLIQATAQAAVQGVQATQSTADASASIAAISIAVVNNNSSVATQGQQAAVVAALKSVATSDQQTVITNNVTPQVNQNSQNQPTPAPLTNTSVNNNGANQGANNAFPSQNNNGQTVSVPSI